MMGYVQLSLRRLLLVLLMGSASFACTTAGTHTTKGEKKEGLADFKYKLATGLLYEKKPIAALRELNIGLQSEPTHAKSLYLTGFIYMGRRNFSEAIQYLKRSVKHGPKLYEARNALAAAYMGSKRWNEALEVLLPLIEDAMNPTPWLAHNNAGWCYHQLNNHLKSVQHLEMSIFYNSKFCLGYYNLGLVLKQRRRYDQAVLRLERANELCPNHASTLLELGDLYEHTARTDEARTAYRKCHDTAKGTILGERCRTREVALR